MQRAWQLYQGWICEGEWIMIKHYCDFCQGEVHTGVKSIEIFLMNQPTNTEIRKKKECCK